MFEIIGKYNKAKVYATTVDNGSYAQVLKMCNMEKLKNSKIAMMPDMHAAEGCTVGTSLTIDEYVNPAFVGGDIGCGMQVFRLSDSAIDFTKLDECIREKIPSGAKIYEKACPQ